METRSKKMLSMVRQIELSSRLLDIPKYESTKGSSQDERKLALDYWKFELEITNICLQRENALCENLKRKLQELDDKRYKMSETNDNRVDDRSEKSDESSSSLEIGFIQPIVFRDSSESETNDEENDPTYRVNIERTKYIKPKNQSNLEMDETSNTNENEICGNTMNVMTEVNVDVNRCMAGASKSRKSGTAKTIIEADININPAIKKEGKRFRDKSHSCYFCHKIITNFAKHLESKHSNELEVAKILAKAKGSKDRREGFSNLMRCGDFYHNCEVLSAKQGRLILSRRPSEAEIPFVTYSDYGPCPRCLGFMHKKHIWYHLKYNCVVGRQENSDKTCFPKGVVAESNALLHQLLGTGLTEEFELNILSKLRDDNIGKYCKQDQLILKFGALQYEKYSVTQSEMIRQSMRQLARLSLRLKEKDGTLSLRDFLHPQKFDDVIESIKIICVSHSQFAKRPEFDIPSLALKLGHALRKCAEIERGAALRLGNLKRNEELTSFLTIMNLEWNIRISSNALTTLYNRKLNNSELLPLTSDLLKLNQFLGKEILEAQQKLCKSPTPQLWTHLAELTLTKIILFNKRRSGEASRMKISHFTSRPQWTDQITEELKNSLTSVERKLAERFSIVEIDGKRGRKVPVILSAETKESIELLITYRKNCEILSENPYIFAANKSLSHLRGHISIKKLCQQLELEHPNYITGTRLRKYVATVTQIFNLTENECDWLARHLGHDMRVHRQFYRLHENAVELTKVSRILLAVDRGEVNKFAGRRLHDIDLNELPNIEEEDLPNVEEEGQHLPNIEEERQDLQNIEGQDELDRGEASELNSEDESNKSIDDVSEIRKKKVISTKNKPSLRETDKRKVTKKYWSSEESQIVLKRFHAFIKRKSLPGKTDCEALIAQHPVLKERKWTDIKFHIKNHITKITRHLS